MHSLFYTISFKGLDHPTKLNIQGGFWNHAVTSKLWENQKLHADFDIQELSTSNLCIVQRSAVYFLYVISRVRTVNIFLSLLILTFIIFMTKTILGFLHRNSFSPFHSVLLGRNAAYTQSGEL